MLAAQLIRTLERHNWKVASDLYPTLVCISEDALRVASIHCHTGILKLEQRASTSATWQPWLECCYSNKTEGDLDFMLITGRLPPRTTTITMYESHP